MKTLMKTIRFKFLICLAVLALLITSLILGIKLIYGAAGSTWTQATSAAAWPARDAHTTVVFNNKMWVIGGVSGSTTCLHDVWYSSDGATWTQATSAAGWSIRHALTSVVFDYKIWIMGGIDCSNNQIGRAHV